MFVRFVSAAHAHVDEGIVAVRHEGDVALRAPGESCGGLRPGRPGVAVLEGVVDVVAEQKKQGRSIATRSVNTSC